MNEPTNNQRAEWAMTALEAFGDVTRQRKNGEWDDEIEGVIGDLIADLFHLCDQEGISIDMITERARMHYEEEREESEEAEDDGD